MVAVPPVGTKVPRCDLQFGRICPAKYTMHRTVIPVRCNFFALFNSQNYQKVYFLIVAVITCYDNRLFTKMQYITACFV